MTYDAGEEPGFNLFQHRLGQKQYCVFVALLLAVAGILGWFRPYPTGSGLTLVWLMIYAWRLHDIGRSGWWAVLVLAVCNAMAAIGAFVAFDGVSYLFGNTAREPAPPASQLWTAGIIVGGALLSQLAFTVWLGLRPGDAGKNRYGWSGGKRPRRQMSFDAPEA